MSNKVTSLALTILLSLSAFIILFTDDAKAMTDEHNLSGTIWLPDGSTPPSQTGFAIWVEYQPGSGNWSRFPDSGWYQTSTVVNSTLWYSLMLPDEWFNIRWGDGAIYRVEVDGIPWGGLATNATSNGTGSAGDPFPTPYDPTNLAHTYNVINYAAGGGTENEQQWDVRIMIFTDLIPTNVTVDGMIPEDYPGGIPAGGGDTVTIYVNATNIGLMPTAGTFDVASWECDVNGVPFDIFNPIQEFLNLGPLNEYGNTTGNGFDTDVLSFSWMAPTQAGDYYINITVDSSYEVLEINETNNTIIIHFIVGPDIIPIDVTVDGVIYPNWPQISPIILPAPGQWIDISLDITNIGASGTGPIPFNVSFYNVSTAGAHLPIDLPFYETGDVFSNLDVGQIMNVVGTSWYAPAPGEFRINLTVDFGYTVSELNESNNTYVLRVLVGPDVLPTNVTVEGVLQPQSPSAPIAVGSGQTVAIGVNATNDGFSPTGRAIWVGFYNSTQTGSMLTQPYYNISVPELAAKVDFGNTTFVTGGHWVAPNAPGTYYVTIYVDIGNDTHEYNETNNSFVLCFTIGPDLTYSNVTVNGIMADVLDPTEVWYVGSGETILIGTNATNVGASPTAITFSVSFTNCTVLGDPIDTPFATFDWTFGLGIGESTTVFIASWVVLDFVGDLYVNITIDYLSDVSESVEINNTYILHFLVGPDYIPGKVTVDGQQALDEAILWNVTAQVPVNIGVNCTNVGVSDVNSSNIYTISFYNSTAARDMVEEFDTVISLSGLPVGGDSGEQVGVWIPPNEPGDYFVLVVVDSTNTTWEFNETNNTFLLHFVIGPDLVPNNVSVNGNPAAGPSQIWYVGIGEQVIIGANATNIGISGTGIPFDMSLYNVSISGSVIIGDSNPQDIIIDLVCSSYCRRVLCEYYS
jgi:subtilase family serine protease